MTTTPAPPRALVMGIVNVTPDSFSDGGRYLPRDAAVARGALLTEQGADILDIGGQSTRPGAQRIAPSEELARVMPVVERLAATGIPVSIDTMRAGVAAAAVLAGASIVNDVSGGLADPAMAATVASLGVDYVCQRWRGPQAATMALGGHADARLDPDPDQPDEVAMLRTALAVRRDVCLRAGIAAEHLILDPGLGFGTTRELDWQVLLRLDEFTDLGMRLLVGPSRKRFLIQELPNAVSDVRKDAATAAVATWCALSGAWAVRVHDAVGAWGGVRVARRLRATTPG